MYAAKITTLLALCAALVACGTFHPNAELPAYDKTRGYRYANLEPGPNNSDSLLVALTFSGGGTRAAALSYGVMEALRKTEIVWKGERKTLLDEVDIISSVSGGSFTAAYYGLHREALFGGEFEDGFLNRDIEKALLFELFKPANWFKLAGPSYGRSDLAADYYDRHVFSGMTYQDLIDRGTRPFVILNTTDMTLGAQFPMIQDQFDLICSDLSKLPIARAVATSSAFPGLLTPLTYRNHTPVCGYRENEPVWVKLASGDRQVNAERARHAAIRRSYYDPESLNRPRRDYVHLIDGGVADNIGLRGPAWAFDSTDSPYSLKRLLNRGTIETLLVIVVNAGTSPDSRLDDSAAVPGALQVLTAAATQPMDNYSFDTVNLLKNSVQSSQRDLQILASCQNRLTEKCPGASLDLSLQGYEAFISQVAFEFIEDPKARHFFQNIGTNFSLPGETVDRLGGIGCTLLANDDGFKKFMAKNGAAPLDCGKR